MFKLLFIRQLHNLKTTLVKTALTWININLNKVYIVLKPQKYWNLSFITSLKMNNFFQILKQNTT